MFAFSLHHFQKSGPAFATSLLHDSFLVFLKFVNPSIEAYISVVAEQLRT
jgi:hypothetical protein